MTKQPYLTKLNSIALVRPDSKRRPEYLGHSPSSVARATLDYQPDESEALAKAIELLKEAITDLAWELPARFTWADTEYRLSRLDTKNIGLQKKRGKRGLWHTVAYCGNGPAVLRSVVELTCVHWTPAAGSLAEQLVELTLLVCGLALVIKAAKTVKV